MASHGRAMLACQQATSTWETMQQLPKGIIKQIQQLWEAASSLEGGKKISFFIKNQATSNHAYPRAALYCGNMSSKKVAPQRLLAIPVTIFR